MPESCAGLLYCPLTCRQTPRHHTPVCCPSSNANIGVCCSHTMVQFNKPHKTWHNACCCCYSPTTSVTPLDVGRTPARPGVGPVGQEASLGRCASTLKTCTKVGPLTGTCCCRNMLSQSANKHNASEMHKTDRERERGVYSCMVQRCQGMQQHCPCSLLAGQKHADSLPGQHTHTHTRHNMPGPTSGASVP